MKIAFFKIKNFLFPDVPKVASPRTQLIVKLVIRIIAAGQIVFFLWDGFTKGFISGRAEEGMGYAGTMIFKFTIMAMFCAALVVSLKTIVKGFANHFWFLWFLTPLVLSCQSSLRSVYNGDRSWPVLYEAGALSLVIPLLVWTHFEFRKKLPQILSQIVH